MKPMLIDRRGLLQGGLGALLGLGLIGGPAVADVLVTDNDALAGGDGVMAAQMRLGEFLIRSLAARKDTGERAKASPNVIVSPASLAAILSLIDLGGSPAMHQGIHRALGYKRTARRKAEKELLAM